MAIYKRGGVWWMDLYVGAGKRRLRKSTGCRDEVQTRIAEQSAVAVNRGITSRQRAMAIIDNLIPAGEEGLKLSDAAEFYRASAKDEGKVMTDNSMAHRVNILAKFAKWCETHSRVKFVEEVDAPVAFAFAKSLADGLTAKTRNAYVGDLGTAWKLFMRHDKAKQNPWGLVRVPRNRDEETTGRAFTPDEVARLRAVGREVGHDWETVMVIGLYTGLRLGDAVSLKWSDVDIAARMIRCEPSKTKKHRIAVSIPLHAKLAAWLEAHRNGSEWVTPDRRVRVGAARFRDGDLTFSQILERAKVVKASERDKLSFHCFRHTMVSRLAEAGVAQEVRMRLVGHTSTANHAIYTHDDVSARAAIDALE